MAPARPAARGRAQVPSVHHTLHAWGASHDAYLVVARDGLEQQATPGSRRLPAREVAFWAGEPAAVHVYNLNGKVPPSLAVSRDATAPPVVVAAPPVPESGAFVYRFTAPAPGRYAFRDNLARTGHRITVVAADPHAVPSLVRRYPFLAQLARGAAIDSHVGWPVARTALLYLFSALNLVLGVLLMVLRPHDRAARLLALGMVGSAAVFNLPAHSLLEEVPGPAIWLHDKLHLAAGLAYMYALLVFPDGRLVPSWPGRRRSRWALQALYVAAFTLVGLIVYRSKLHGSPTGFVVFFGLLIPAAGITSQAFRYRQAATPSQREQSRLLLWALGLALAVGLVLGATGVVINGLHVGLSGQTIVRLQGVAFLVFPLLFALIPLTLFVVLVRYRLWDVDRLINRTLVYGVLTVTLGAAYVGAVVLLQQLFHRLTGGSSLAVALSTLAAAALFQPARDRVQTFIDRRFYRRKYDAARALDAFSARLREQIDLDHMSRELLAVVRETMQPACAWLWLRDMDDGEAPAAPPSRDGAPPSRDGAPPSVELPPGDPVVAWFERPRPAVTLDELPLASPGAQALRTAGVHLLVPLIGQGRLVGLLNLGPRRSGREYSADDRDLLDRLAGQAAPALRLAQLVRRQEALVRRQEAEVRDRERIDQELRLARLIQQQFLPRALPSLPGWQVSAHYQPARAVGGDFYDFIQLADGQVGVVVGDVSDKGVPAALIMATTHSILRGEAPRLDSPGKVLERANDLLLDEMPEHMFVTCLYAVLDPASGVLRYANAGHDVPYVRTAEGVTELRATGMPLGLLPHMAYEDKQAVLAPGDRLLLHSDGLVEAHDPERRMFEFPRLAHLVGECPPQRGLIEVLLAELCRFTGAGWEQEDDITLVTLERTGDQPSHRRTDGAQADDRRASAPAGAAQAAADRAAADGSVEPVAASSVPTRR